MFAAIISLSIAYILSQFYRSFLTVLSPYLMSELSISADDLALSLGLWFLTFSAMQIPVGWALDKFGPRGVSSFLLIFGAAGGAALFSVSVTSYHIHVAMIMLGAGCAPILMASYFIFSHNLPAKNFATMASVVTGVGSLGLLIGSIPLALSIDLLGWRISVAIISFLTLVIGIVLFLTIKPSASSRKSEPLLQGYKALCKIKQIWIISPMIFACYAPVSGMRGIWLAPFLENKFNAKPEQISHVSMLMSIAMILGIFSYGPLDRIFKTRKWVVFSGNLVCGISFFILIYATHLSYALSVFFFICIGFFGMSFPLIVAHGKSFLPSNLMGRGVTLMNLFAISGAGFLQILGSLIYSQFEENLGGEIFSLIFILYTVVITGGLLSYIFVIDRLD